MLGPVNPITGGADSIVTESSLFFLALAIPSLILSSSSDNGENSTVVCISDGRTFVTVLYKASVINVERDALPLSSSVILLNDDL